MREIHALITELTSDFVHTVQTTDDKHLEVQLRGNTEVHVHVEVVVVGHERLGSSTASNGVEHRGLNGDKVPVIEPATDVGVNLGTGNKNIAGLLVHHEVQVALAETLLGVLEAIVVVGDLPSQSVSARDSPGSGTKHTWCRQGDSRMTSTAPIDSSPEYSPSPCFFWGLDRMGKPRTPDEGQ